MDKASILAETITYLKELEQRVDELESSRAPSSRSKEAPGWELHEVARRKRIKLSTGSKRKVLESEKDDDDCPSNIVNVTVMDKEVFLEVQCRWKELLMTRVFDAIKSLRLDIVSVHASTPEGLLDLKIRASQQVSIAPTSKVDLAIYIVHHDLRLSDYHFIYQSLLDYCSLQWVLLPLHLG